MSSTFAKQIEKAASAYPGTHSTAWVQYAVNPDGRTVTVRMQAPEIMKEFRGSVKFGTDPKGILFFGSVDDLNIVGNIKVRNSRYTVSGTIVVVETEFGSPGGDRFDGFARFVAEVDTATYKIPADFTDAIGTGRMTDFDAVTCHVQASRTSRTATVNLGSNSIHKQVHFTSNISNVQISQSGVMFFRDIMRLKTQPNNRDYCVANYNSDRIVFHIENAENEFVALFLPNKPMNKIGEGVQRVTWEDFEASTIVSSTEAEE